MVRCRDATVSSFVVKFRGEVFANFQASRRKASQQCAKLIVSSARANSL
jgi:Fe-S cluster assembly scaffold protein SufB